MRKLTFLLCFFCAVVSGCADFRTEKDSKDNGAEWLKNVEFEMSRDNVEGNLRTGGDIIEKDGLIIFGDSVYDEKSHSVRSLCTDPTCDHINRPGCIARQGLSLFQICEGNIICVCKSNVDLDEDIIYALDAEAGRVSVYFDSGMPVDSFTVVGNGLVLILSDNVFFVADVNTGRKAVIFDAKDSGVLRYTRDEQYLYVLTENHSLHRVCLDGTGDDLIIVQKASWPIAYGGFVYYGSWDDESFGVRRVNRDGSGDELVGEDMYTFTVYDGKIYYRTASRPGKLKMCNVDGSEKTQILSAYPNVTVLPGSSRIILTYDGPEYQIMNTDGTEIKEFP